MNIIFFGTTEYSVQILNFLVSIGEVPSLVVTQPDKAKGRGLNKSPTLVKEFSLKKGLEVVTPYDLRENMFVSLLKRKNPELFVVASYGQFLPWSVLNLPRVTPVGVHPSLLPKYRGAAPVNWALINGEKETGVSLFKVEEKMDAGPVIRKNSVFIAEDDDYLSLFSKVTEVSKEILGNTLPFLRVNKFSLVPQDDNKASFAPKIDKKMAKIDWGKPAGEIKNLIRGLVPAPCAWGYFRKKRIKFWKSSVYNKSVEPGDKKPGDIVIVFEDKLGIKTGKGVLTVSKLQPEGKKVIGAKEFINGYQPKAGEQFA